MKLKILEHLNQFVYFFKKKKISAHVKIFVYYNIRTYLFLIFVNIFILIIVYIIESLGNLLLNMANQEKKLSGHLTKLYVFPSEREREREILFIIKKKEKREKEKVREWKLKILEHSNQFVYLLKKKKINSCKSICLL